MLSLLKFHSLKQQIVLVARRPGVAVGLIMVAISIPILLTQFRLRQLLLAQAYKQTVGSPPSIVTINGELASKALDANKWPLLLVSK